MRLLLISIFAIFLVVLLTPNAFAVQYPVIIHGGVADNRGMNFLPSVIEIEKGDTITWKNLERGVYHTVTSASELFDERLINCAYFEAGVGICGNEQNQAKKQTFSYTFGEFGTYDYNCKLHSWMNGVVKVIELGQDAEIQIHGDAGDMYIDKSVNVVGAAPIEIKIYGNVKNPGAGNKVIFSITDPNGDTESQTTFIKQNGEYQLVISVNHDDVGVYSVTATFVGDNIGTVSFTIVKRSIPEELFPKQDHENLGLTEGISKGVLTVNTDFSSYKSGDTIRISGITTLPQWSQVTIQVINPQNNIVTVSQVSTRDDGTYSTSINSEGPLFRVGGAYTIKVNYATEQVSTKFFLDLITNPQSPIESPNTRTATFLKLDSLDNTFRVEKLDSRSSMTFSGQLLKIDRQSTIPGAVITFVFTGFTMDGNDYHKITTDNNGKFDFGVTMPVGEGYAVQAVYDGSLNYKSSKSQTEYFDIRIDWGEEGTTEEQMEQIGMIMFGVLVLVLVIVVVVIAKKMMKKKPVTIPPPSGGGTMGSATITKTSKPRKTPRGPIFSKSQIRQATSAWKRQTRSAMGRQSPKAKSKIRQAKRAVGIQAKRAVGRQSSKSKSKMDTIHYLRCKVCLSEELENEADGQQYCTKCEWRKK